ncbi:MAG: Lipid II flippase FtsW [Firmicutes bacterium ADurb.Bin182]|nr:MAG: Lipid II flippase FtsW [Firmicutes bacterium ADurb.Bin182]
MEKRTAGEKGSLGHMDFSIFFAVLLICAFGLVMVFSASYYYAQSEWHDGYYFVKKQIQYLVLGFICMLVLSRIDYHKLEKLKTAGMLLSIALLIAVLLFGEERNGAKRWLEIAGQGFQPSEFCKFAMMLYIVSFMAKYPSRMKDFAHGVVPVLLMILIICGLIMLQPNMSMAVSIALMGGVLLFMGGARISHLLILAVAAVPMFFLLSLEEYRWARVTIFTDPWKDPLGSGHQLIQSLYALGSGGLFGQGLNYSRQKLLYLTYGESDFIFSIIGEELGFIGCVLVMSAYFFLIYRGIRTALKCKDRFGSLLAGGITVVLAIQVAVNIGVATSSIPPTGQTLPFISAGGTSLFIFLAAVGVLLNVSRNTARI